MRTMTQERTAPASQYTVTTYGCDECDFTADDQQDVEEHYAKEHACRGKLETPGRTLYRFTSEADANAWIKQYADGFSRAKDAAWDGPGWYTIEAWDEPCSRGCCTHNCVTLTPADRWLRERIEEARRIMRFVTAIRAAIKEAADG